MAENLGDYALLGDLHTVALVSGRGGLDWLCAPRFDSAACFAALTHDGDGDGGGDGGGGTWLVRPEQAGRATRRRYRPGTLVLESEWDTQDGTVRLVDCMVRRDTETRVVRIVEGVTGRVPMRVLFQPRFDGGARTPWLRCAGRSVSAVAGSDALWLDADVSFDRVSGHSAAAARFAVAAGQRVGFVLTHASSHLPQPRSCRAADLVAAADLFWSTWSAGVDAGHPPGDVLPRAAITLKALTHAPTGAVITTPVYRDGRPPHLCDVGHAAATLRALLDAGLTDEARAWREWLVRAAAGDPRGVARRYTVDGRGDPSAPTGRAGTVGELLYGLNSADHLWLPARDSAWDLQLGLLDHLESTWELPDHDHHHGEPGAASGHHVVAKVRAWAGLDRAVDVAERHGLPGPVDRWRAVRARLRAEVCGKGYDPVRNTFTRRYGAGTADETLLLLPEVGFLPWQDARIRGTVRSVAGALLAQGDDPPGTLIPGTTMSAGFRLVRALHGIGDTAAAAALLDRLLSTGNDVGLFGEFYDPDARRTGPTPHAASVIGLMNALRHVRPRRCLPVT